MNRYQEDRYEELFSAQGTFNQATSDLQDLVWKRTYSGDNSLDAEIMKAANWRDKCSDRLQSIRMELDY